MANQKINNLIPVTNKTVLYVKSGNLIIYPVQSSVFYEGVQKSISSLELLTPDTIAYILSTSRKYAEILKGRLLEGLRKTLDFPRGNEFAPGISKISARKWLITGFSMRSADDKVSKERQLRMLLPIAGAATFIVNSGAIVKTTNGIVPLSDLSIALADKTIVIYEVSKSMRYNGGAMVGSRTARGSVLIPGVTHDRFDEFKKIKPTSMFHHSEKDYELGYFNWQKADEEQEYLLPAVEVAASMVNDGNSALLIVAWESRIKDIESVYHFLADQKHATFTVVFLFRGASYAKSDVLSVFDIASNESGDVALGYSQVSTQRHGVSNIESRTQKYVPGFSLDPACVQDQITHDGYNTYPPEKYCSLKKIPPEYALQGNTTNVKFGEPVFVVANDGSIVYTTCIEARQVHAFRAIGDAPVKYGTQFFVLSKKIDRLLAQLN